MFPLLVWVEILEYLAIADLLILRQVSKELKAMVDFKLHHKWKIVKFCKNRENDSCVIFYNKKLPTYDVRFLN